MKKVGVILAGCGVKDGSEIHEAVIALLVIDRAGAEAIMMAPDVPSDEIDHLTEQPTGLKRKVLVESARIARGKIRNIADVVADDIDALILPGGLGAAKNLSNFAFVGTKAKAHPEVERLVKEVHRAKKPMGAICIAPATIAAILGADHHPDLTIGNDPSTARALEVMGAIHHNCKVNECYVDKTNKIVSTPAYMLALRISEVADGIEKLVQKVLELS